MAVELPDDLDQRVHALGRCASRVTEGPPDAGGVAPTRWTYEVFPERGERFEITKQRAAHTDQRDGPVPGQWVLVVYRPEDPQAQSAVFSDRAQYDIQELAASIYSTAGRPAPTVFVPDSIRNEYRYTVAAHREASGPRTPFGKALLVLLVACILGGLYVIFSGVFSNDHRGTVDASRTAIGSVTVATIEQGDWTVWIEDNSAFADRNEAEEYGVSVAIRAVGGDDVELRDYRGHSTERGFGPTRIALATFTAPATAQYEITATGGNGEAESVVVGSGSRVAGVFASVGLGLGIIFGGVIVVAVLAAVLNRWARRRQGSASSATPA